MIDPTARERLARALCAPESWTSNTHDGTCRVRRPTQDAKRNVASRVRRSDSGHNLRHTHRRKAGPRNLAEMVAEGVCSFNFEGTSQGRTPGTTSARCGVAPDSI